MCAESGIAYVRSLIRSHPDGSQLVAVDDPERFRDVAVETMGGGVPGTFSVVAPVDGTEPRYGLVNLSARINLNSLVVYEEDAARLALLQLPGMSQEIADAILDWIDDDDEPRQYGVESSYYESLSPGYRCGNGPLKSLDELLLVKDVTFEALFGRDVNRNGRIDDSEVANANEGDFQNDGSGRWCQWLTTSSSESNLRSDGRQKIDLNGPDLAAVFDTLKDEFGDDVAKLVIGYRLYGPIQPEPPEDVRPVAPPPSTGFEPSAGRHVTPVRRGIKITVVRAGMILNGGPRYSIRSAFELIGIQIGFVDPTGDLIRSPWNVNSLDDSFTAFEQAVTIRPRRRIAGRINVLNAARPVLAGIPGMSDEALEKILEFRAQSDAVGLPSSLATLWGQANIELTTMRQIAPFLTTGGDVFAGQIIGQLSGQPYCRLEFTIDTTDRSPRLTMCRDLTNLGRGL